MTWISFPLASNQPWCRLCMTPRVDFAVDKIVSIIDSHSAVRFGPFDGPSDGFESSSNWWFNVCWKFSLTSSESRALIFSLLQGCFMHVGGRTRMLSWLQIRRWSVQHSAPHIARAIFTSWRSERHTITKSITCQCFKRGCIHEVLYFFWSWNMVLVIQRENSEQTSSKRRPLLLLLPTPCRPMTVCHNWWSVPTRALKSPSQSSLSVRGTYLSIGSLMYTSYWNTKHDSCLFSQLWKTHHNIWSRSKVIVSCQQNLHCEYFKVMDNVISTTSSYQSSAAQ